MSRVRVPSPALLRDAAARRTGSRKAVALLELDLKQAYFERLFAPAQLVSPRANLPLGLASSQRMPRVLFNQFVDPFYHW